MRQVNLGCLSSSIRFSNFKQSSPSLLALFPSSSPASHAPSFDRPSAVYVSLAASPNSACNPPPAKRRSKPSVSFYPHSRAPPLRSRTSTGSSAISTAPSARRTSRVASPTPIAPWPRRRCSSALVSRTCSAPPSTTSSVAPFRSSATGPTLRRCTLRIFRGWD